MRQVNITSHEKLSFKLKHQLNKGEQRRLDLYFSLPKEMGINSNTLSETEYFNSAITGQRAYFTQGLHLPLLHTRFASRMKRSPDEYRVNLNLFAYQYLVALDTDIAEALILEDSEYTHAFYDAALVLASNSLTILKKLRRNAPNDVKLNAIFENVDNYLSWYTEQSLLKMLAQKPRQSDYSQQRNELLQFCEQENKYRLSLNYNSTSTLNDPNRISNKMRLLRRLIEHGVVFREQTTALGSITRKVVTGVATALVMTVVLTLIIKTQGALSGITSVMILVLSVIYGVREVFKDDFKNMLWRWIRRGKPKWLRTLKDTVNQTEMAKQKIWLDYIRSRKLPKQAQELLARRHTQNQQSAELLHYRLETRVANSEFQPGYESLEETIIFSLRPLARYLERGQGKLFELNGEKIQKTAIERRYQINVIIALNQGFAEEEFERYKITLNRSGIIDVEHAGTYQKPVAKEPEQ
ncbi:hypothetical protein Q4519_09860 [Motilimonas sp. 1_MG-2023]|uniref:hypothetical protein n=1 Tax=Motilimonas sp. 1_MG-2023 TaxID=3062672 RepID=UPI0026E2DB0F|nr:hypothetical protein [Motilimonas sp. 1_MG-2023]MDO6525984.1 hypothetical protein [Motilimonas sp. 1_MG-2023]